MPSPVRILAMDIGSGTQDILLYEAGQPIENCIQLVLPSPTRLVGARIRGATAAGQPIFLTGVIMGGGDSAGAARDHVRAGLKCYATEPAAKTFHDNLDRVREWGIEIVDEPPEPCRTIVMRDVDVDALQAALTPFAVRLPERLAIAVQDHGHSPHTSNRLARNAVLRTYIEASGRPTDLAYLDPPTLYTRMHAVLETVPGALVMDTGSAAILGGGLDPLSSVPDDAGLTMVNLGNAHTLAALVHGERIWGLFEHHTSAMDDCSLRRYLALFRAGKLTERQVYDDGGHGCHVREDRPTVDYSATIIMGPQRARAAGLGRFAAPYGSMMLTGCFGLVRAALHHWGMPGTMIPDDQ